MLEPPGCVVMDLAKFGFRCRPFRPTPDTSMYCGNEAIETVSLAVQRAFANGHSAALVTGGPGTGKTLLGLRFLESLPSETRRVILHSPPAAKPADFFQALLFDMGQPYQGLSEQELRLAVHGELLTSLADGKTVVILMDEAHNLTAEVIEEVRLLGNLESKYTKAVFVLLVGLPAIHDLIHKAGGNGFEQRLAVRGVLEPLSRDESIRFIRHQVRESGGRPEWVITDEALTVLADQTDGIPRVLNRTAALAFEIAGAAGQDEVDAEAVLEALDQLGLMKPSDSRNDLLPLRPVAALSELEPNTVHPIQLGRTPRTTLESPQKKRSKRKSA
jgi:type II secretory pathway predicted ATPase ExeA